MIEKIVNIKNYGRFSNFVTNSTFWSGTLDKVVAIYADNGTGKTTLAQVFKSIKGDNDLINKRKTFGSSDDIDIFLLGESNKQFKFQNNKWNKYKKNVEVFDSFFVESNVYIITLGNYDRKGNYFELVIGDEAIKLFDKIVELRRERRRLAQARVKYRRNIRISDDSQSIKQLNKKIDWSLKRSEKINEEISVLDNKLTTTAESFGELYLEKINYYLKYFCPSIQLSKLNKRGTNFVYYIKIKNYDVRSDSQSVSLKHTLSEGDKSALALSFFLARISIHENLDKKIIIFDDPISSFDSARRSVTINQLYNLSKKSKQFILLSHDISFVKDFFIKCEQCQSLKIINTGDTSRIVEHDILHETMTGIFKDLTILYNYIERGANSDFGKREVIRCIRPTIEGLFRIKFFKNISSNEWLGDVIKKIRESTIEDNFYHLKPILDELIDINDYSKSYHHSNPNYLEMPINDEELRNYTQRTLDLLIKI